MARFIFFGVLVFFGYFFFFSGPSQEDEWKAFMTEAVAAAQLPVNVLGRKIDSGQVANTKLLTSYANYLRKNKPEYTEIVDALAVDATSDGPIYQGLKSRMAAAKTAAEAAPMAGEKAVQSAWVELDLLKGAATAKIYGMMLTDPINVLADMSGGQLGRVEAMSKDAEQQAGGGEDGGAGARLVGNPHYGQWRNNSSGQSIWAWYGQYAFFSTMFGTPYRYSNWAGGRHYSYYHDYGRSHYTSPSQFRSQSTVNTQAQSKFKQSGKTFNSPYATTRTGAASTVSKPVSSASRSGGGFKSAYATSSSARSAARSSRSSSGGK